MTVATDIRLLDGILIEWKTTIGSDYDGYRNHVHRVIRYCLALDPCSPEQRMKIIIAGAFHDIGIWVGNTLDYILPSLPPAAAYLKDNGLESWSSEIGLMMGEHHKVREYSDPAYPLVELFRKGDLIDLSMGLFKFGLPGSEVDRIRAERPNAGFHRGLVRKAARWLVRHPLDPAPMMKW